MKILEWVKKNWLRLIIVISAVVLLFYVLSVVRSCDEAAYQKDIAKLDEEILELETDNERLEEEKGKAIAGAKAAEKVVAEKEVEIAEAELRIKALEKEEIKITQVVAELPPSELVKETREILECAEVKLTDDGILFSVECMRSNLEKLKRFSLVENKYNEATFALSTSKETLQFQKMATWYVYRIAWAQGSQIMNYRSIVKKQDLKFVRCEKQRKRNFLKGAIIGVIIGAGIVVTIVIVVPLIKLIF